MEQTLNYYDLLGVKETATAEEIKKAYREQIKKWHPDVNKSKDAAVITQKLNEAKEVLLDEAKRRAFDQELKQSQNRAYEEFKNDTKSKQTNTQSSQSQNSQNQTHQSSSTSSNQSGNLTKWKYLYLWIRFGNASAFRKVLGIIGTIVETLFCKLIVLLTIALKYCLRFISFITRGVGRILLFIIVFCLVIYFFIGISDGIHAFSETKDLWKGIMAFFGVINKIFTNFNDSDIRLLQYGAISLILGYGLKSFVNHLLTPSTFIFINVKLDIILFKKCVGYK